MAMRKITKKIEEVAPIETPVVEEAKEVIEEKKPVKKTAKKKVVKVDTPRINVRKTPSLLGDILGIAVQNDKFDLVNDSEDGFYEIAYNGSTAFLMKDYCKLA